MKKLIFPLLLLIGCQTTHKTVTDLKKSVDSVSHVQKDSSFTGLQLTHDENLSVKGIDIVITYPSGHVDSSYTKDTALNVKDVMKEQDFIFDHGEIPQSIRIHIDSLTDKKTSSEIKDSIVLKEKVNTQVKTSSESYSKQVTRTGIPFYLYLIGGLVLLSLIAFYLIRKKIL